MKTLQETFHWTLYHTDVVVALLFLIDFDDYGSISGGKCWFDLISTKKRWGKKTVLTACFRSVDA